MAYTDKKMELPDGFIDLGEELKGTGVVAIEPVSQKNSYHYPSLYFDNAKGMESLPESGTATIYFKKVMERKETVSTESGTEKRYTVELQICGIKPDKESEPEMDLEDPEDAFEREMSKYESEEESKDEEEGEDEE